MIRWVCSCKVVCPHHSQSHWHKVDAVSKSARRHRQFSVQIFAEFRAISSASCWKRYWSTSGIESDDQYATRRASNIILSISKFLRSFRSCQKIVKRMIIIPALAERHVHCSGTFLPEWQNSKVSSDTYWSPDLPWTYFLAMCQFWGDLTKL